MQKSFPSLVNLDLLCHPQDTLPVIPRKFLGGSAPHLRHLHLRDISAERLSTLLLSTSNLVTLTLDDIPLVDCTSGDMARILATLNSLTSFSISCYEGILPSDQWQSQTDPPMRAIVHALTRFFYKGHSQCLEDLLAQVDMPQVDYISIEYPTYQIQTSHLSRFIERTENFKIEKFTCAEVVFYDEDPFFALGREEGIFNQAHLLVRVYDDPNLEVHVRGMVHILRQLAPIFSNVGALFAHGYLAEQHSSSIEMDITHWLPLFRLFPAAEVLRLSGEVGVYIASALEDTAEEMVAEVLPALRLIKLAKDELDNEDAEVDQDYWDESGASVERFPFLRQFSGCPVIVLGLEDEFVEAEWRR